MAQAKHKLVRVQHARDTCHDCMEAEGLDAVLQAAKREHRLLTALYDYYTQHDTVSLPALIMHRAERARAQVARHARGWRSGQRTPAAYWEAEADAALLMDLLRRYNAWAANRPYYPEVSPSLNGKHPQGRSRSDANGRWPDGGGYFNPWNLRAAPHPGGPFQEADEPEAQQAALSRALRQIDEALRACGCLEGHVEVVMQPDGTVLAKGYAHDDDERQRAIAALLRLESVRELIIDLRVVTPGNCPVCRLHHANGTLP